MARPKDDHKREAIFAAAIKLFARKGFHGATMAEVARGAGVASGTLYLYYHNKDRLLGAIFEDFMTHILRNYADFVLAAPTAAERIRRLIQKEFEVFAVDPDRARVFLTELVQPSPNLQPLVARSLRRYTVLVKNIFVNGAATGEMRSVNPRVAALMLVGAMQSVAQGWTLHAAHPNALTSLADEVADALVLGWQKR